MEKKSGTTKKAAAAKKAPREKKAARSASATSEKKTVQAKSKAPRKHRHGKSCKVKNCNRGYRAKGYCTAHYRQWRHGKFAKARYTRCHDYGCTKAMGMNRHGYCEEHYTNYYIKGMEVTHAPVAEPKKEAAETAA